MRRAKNRVLLGSILLPALLSMACGYALVGRGSNIPEDVEIIFLSPLENNTRRAQVEQILLQAIADEVVLRGRFDLATQEEGADAVLDGTITGFLVTPVTFDDEGLAEEYEISISATMEFRRTPSGGILWRNPNYIFRENYVLTEEEASFFDREILAIEAVAELFAKTLLTDLMEGF
ncbi:MAG: LPS assembly lipoprotein LptE [Thermoanaerobaculia bacterium]|nr:LPS assembly lipoprotein LptE [Thermoanaerobaculia bacterium]